MKLTDICDFQGGSQPPKNEWSFDKKDGYIRMLQIRDFTQSERVTPEYVKISPRLKYCESDDILIGRYGASVGKILTGKAGAYNVAIMKSIPDISQVRKKYMRYYFLSKPFQNYILNLGGRAAQAGFSKDDLERLSFSLVDLNKQDDRISQLEKIESAIEIKNNQLLSLDELIKSRFIEMFGDPIANDKKWETSKLAKVCKVINGRAYSEPELLDEGKYRVLRVGNFFTNNSWYYSNLELPDDKYCSDGDLLFAWSASFGPRIWHGEKVIYHYHIWKLDEYQNHLNKVFFMELLNHQVEVLKNNTHGSTMQHFTKADMENQILILPPIELQNEFASFVEQTDKSKFIVQSQIKDLQELLDKKMDEYFNNN